MRDPKRIPEVMAVLQKLWEQNPDWRLGQLVDNIAHRAFKDTFYIEDDKWVETAKAWAARGDESL